MNRLVLSFLFLFYSSYGVGSDDSASSPPCNDFSLYVKVGGGIGTNVPNIPLVSLGVGARGFFDEHGFDINANLDSPDTFVVPYITASALYLYNPQPRCFNHPYFGIGPGFNMDMEGCKGAPLIVGVAGYSWRLSSCCKTFIQLSGSIPFDTPSSRVLNGPAFRLEFGIGI